MKEQPASPDTQIVLSFLERMDRKMDSLGDKVEELRLGSARQEAVNTDVSELKEDIKQVKDRLDVLEKGALFIRGGYKTLTAVGGFILFITTALYHFVVVRGFFHKG